MIKKFLYIHGSRVHLSSSFIEDEQKSQLILELALPIQAYWEIQEQLRLADFLSSVHSADVSQTEISDIHNRVLRLSAPHAANEADRELIYKKFSQSS